jgi:hypothetical protein
MDLAQIEARLKTATAECRRLSEALHATAAEAAAVRASEAAALARERMARGELVAAKLRVAVLQEGLCADLGAVARAEPEAYMQLRREAAELMLQAPSDELRGRYASLYEDALHRASSSSQRCSSGGADGGSSSGGPAPS